MNVWDEFVLLYMKKWRVFGNKSFDFCDENLTLWIYINVVMIILYFILKLIILHFLQKNDKMILNINNIKNLDFQ